jgi:ubiquinone/menaquinone biosynthesis C-methylase UbiE
MEVGDMVENNVFDGIVESYEKWFKRNDKLLESELHAIKQMLPTKGKGIDIGVGTGIFASRLEIMDGIEPSPQMAAVARSRRVNFIEGVEL